MFPGRRFAVVATAISLAAGGFSWMSPAAAAADGCANAADISVLPSPLAPWSGAPLRVMVISETPVEGVLSLTAPDGSVALKSPDRHDGPPYAWFAEVATPAAGTWRATLDYSAASASCTPVTREISVSAKKPAPFDIPAGRIWPVKNSWDLKNESLFSAWVAKLFDAPPDQDLNWKVWYEVLRDPTRNFLFNYLGRNEDQTQTSQRPDCADFVYFLRAYFAFKMGLPFGYSNCSRGAGNSPPKCYQWFDVEHPEVTRPPPPPSQAQDAVASDAAPPQEQPKPFSIFGRSEPPPPPAAPPGPRLRRRLRRRRSGRRISANICATSAMSSTPAPCARATKTPISIPCR